MGNILNRIGKLLLVFCLTLAVAQSGLLEGCFSLDALCSPIECSDASDQAGESYSDCTGDEFLMMNSKINADQFPVHLGILSRLPDPLIAKHSSEIWQPPRIM